MACKGHPASICWLLSGPCHSSHQSTQAPRFERRCLQHHCTLKEINGAERCLYEALHACGLIFTRSPTRLQDFSAHSPSSSKGAAPDLDYFAFVCLQELRLCFLLKPASLDSPATLTPQILRVSPPPLQEEKQPLCVHKDRRCHCSALSLLKFSNRGSPHLVNRASYPNRREAGETSCHPLPVAADMNRRLFVPAEFYHLAGPVDPNAPTTATTAYKCTPFFVVCVCVRELASQRVCSVWLVAFRRRSLRGFSEQTLVKICTNSSWGAIWPMRGDPTNERGLLWLCASFRVCSAR